MHYSINGVVVGMPVTWHPPHRSGREVFPHPAPRLYSLRSQQVILITLLLFPTLWFAHVSLIYIVRYEFPVRATYSRHSLPLVIGFPNLWVLWNDPTPIKVISAFPMQSTPRLPESRNNDGYPKFLNASLCTCHSLRTPETLHILTIADASVLTSVYVKTLVDLNFVSKLYQLSGATSPYGLHNSLCTLHLYCSNFHSPPQAQHSIRVAG